MPPLVDTHNSVTPPRALHTSRLPAVDVRGGHPGRVMLSSARVMPRDPRVKVHADIVAGLQERRRRRRAQVMPMYTQAVVRVLSSKEPPLEGHILDVSESGMLVNLDSRIPAGQAVTVEFRVAGLGRVIHEEWREYVAAAVVVRQHEEDDFPGGPHRMGLRFVRISTMVQAQIARFVATRPG